MEQERRVAAAIGGGEPSAVAPAPPPPLWLPPALAAAVIVLAASVFWGATRAPQRPGAAPFCAYALPLQRGAGRNEAPGAEAPLFEALARVFRAVDGSPRLVALPREADWEPGAPGCLLVLEPRPAGGRPGALTVQLHDGTGEEGPFPAAELPAALEAALRAFAARPPEAILVPGALRAELSGRLRQP